MRVVDSATEELPETEAALCGGGVEEVRANALAYVPDGTLGEQTACYRLLRFATVCYHVLPFATVPYRSLAPFNDETRGHQARRPTV